MYSVYVHTNKENGKRYVGITSCDVNIRWKKGFGYSDKLPIGRAIRKYGWNGFSHEVLFQNLSEESAKSIEKKLITQWQTQDPNFGYNICAGGEGVTGWHPSEQTRRKISDSAKRRTGEKNPNYGHIWTDEMKAASGKKHRRENLSGETLKKMSMAASNRTGDSNPFYGRRHSDATKQKLSKARRRPVKMFDHNGVFLKKFDSINAASDETGIHKVAISNCCRGVTKTSGGFLWKYSNMCDL